MTSVNIDELAHLPGPDAEADALREAKQAIADLANLTGNALADEVMKDKTFYGSDYTNKLTGTLELTGDAAVGDVVAGKTFYKDDPQTQLAGTLTLTGDAGV